MIIKNTALDSVFSFDSNSVFFESDGEGVVNIDDLDSEFFVNLFSVDINVVGEFEIDFSDCGG